MTIDREYLCVYHPDSFGFAAAGGKDPFSPLTDVEQWIDLAVSHAVHARVNVVLPDRMFRPQWTAQIVTRFVQARYRIEVIILDAPATYSLAACWHREQVILDRTGIGTRTTRNSHDVSFDGVIHAATAVGTGQLFAHRLTIVPDGALGPTVIAGQS